MFNFFNKQKSPFKQGDKVRFTYYTSVFGLEKYREYVVESLKLLHDKHWFVKVKGIKSYTFSTDFKLITR